MTQNLLSNSFELNLFRDQGYSLSKPKQFSLFGENYE